MAACITSYTVYKVLSMHMNMFLYVGGWGFVSGFFFTANHKWVKQNKKIILLGVLCWCSPIQFDKIC